MRCVVFQPYYLMVGGAEKNATKVASELEAHGWDVILALPGDGPVKDLALNMGLAVTVKRPPKILDIFGGGFGRFSFGQLIMFGIALLFYSLRMAFWLRRVRADLVIMNTVRAPLIVGLAPRLAGIPSVLYLRGYVPSSSRWEQLVLRWLAWAPQRIISVSRESFATFTEKMRTNDRITAEKKLTVVYNWIDPVGVAGSGKLNISSRPIVIGSLANICARKGIHYLVLMAHELRARGVNVVVQVAGAVQEPEYHEMVLEQVRNFELDQVVKFPGFVDAHQFLQQADIFVLASDHEGMPMAILEAMQHGVPVVAFAAEGVTEALGGGTAGRVVPVGDWEGLTEQVFKLATNPAVRADLGAAGEKRSHAFRKDVQVEQLIGVLCAAIGE